MESLIILILVNIILSVSFMFFMIYAVDARYNYHFTQAQDDVIFLETFEDPLKLMEKSNAPLLHDPNLVEETVFEGIA